MVSSIAMYHKQFNEISVIYLHVVKCTQFKGQKSVLFQTIQFSQQSWMVSSIAMYHKQFNWISVIYLHAVKCKIC